MKRRATGPKVQGTSGNIPMGDGDWAMKRLGSDRADFIHLIWHLQSAAHCERETSSRLDVFPNRYWLIAIENCIWSDLWDDNFEEAPKAEIECLNIRTGVFVIRLGIRIKRSYAIPKGLQKITQKTEWVYYQSAGTEEVNQN